MKTLFITVYDGTITKNIVRSGILDRLQRHYRLVLFVRENKTLYFRHYLSGRENIIIEAAPRGRFRRVEAFMNLIFLNSVHGGFALHTLRYHYRLGQIGVLKKAIRFSFWWLGQFRFWRELLRFCYRRIPDRSYDPYFRTYHPDAVFATHMMNDDDMHLIAAARRFGVRAIGMMKSWDNISSKAMVPMRPDWFIAQNEIIRDEMVRFLDFSAERVYVAGQPQWDIYADESIYVSRETFFKELGLDPRKKLIVYTCAGLYLAPHELDAFETLLEAERDGKIKYPVEIILRPHPNYSSGEDRLAGTYGNFKLDRPGKNITGNIAYAEFDEADMRHLANSLRHADVVITVISTINIEAAIAGRPIIDIAFDGRDRLHPELSVARHYTSDHLKRIVVTGGVKLARSADELVLFINRYLDNPDLEAEGRRRIVREQCGSVDGRAGERVARFIIERVGV